MNELLTPERLDQILEENTPADAAMLIRAIRGTPEPIPANPTNWSEMVFYLVAGGVIIALICS